MSAQPVTVLEPAPTLRAIVRHALERSERPDPRAIHDQLLAALSGDQFVAAASYGLSIIIGEESRRLRSTAMGREPRPSGKWAAAERAVAERPELFQSRIVVGRDEHGADVYAFLGDCDKAMLAGAAALLREHGDHVRASTHAQADRYEVLARKLRRGAVVRSLPIARVRAILEA